MVDHALAFLAVSALVIVTPGQDTALTIRNTLLGDRRAGVASAVGVASGQACWTIAASFGLAALLAASEPAFLAVKAAGAAYLVLLGAQTLLRAFRREPRPASGVSREALTCRTAFRQGLISNLGNPKMAVFFTGLLPQFGGGSVWTMLPLGLAFCCMTLTWLSAYAAAVSRAGDVLRRSRVHRVLDAVTGTVLVGLGVRLAAERR